MRAKWNIESCLASLQSCIHLRPSHIPRRSELMVQVQAERLSQAEEINSKQRDALAQLHSNVLEMSHRSLVSAA